MFHVTDQQQNTVDAWLEAMRKDIDSWDSKQPCRILHHLERLGSVAMVSYTNWKIAQLRKDYRLTRKVRIAILLQQPALVAIIRTMATVGTLSMPNSLDVIPSAFSDRDKAIEWLAEG